MAPRKYYEDSEGWSHREPRGGRAKETPKPPWDHSSRPGGRAAQTKTRNYVVCGSCSAWLYCDRLKSKEGQCQCGAALKSEHQHRPARASPVGQPTPDKGKGKGSQNLAQYLSQLIEDGSCPAEALALQEKLAQKIEQKTPPLSIGTAGHNLKKANAGHRKAVEWTLKLKAQLVEAEEEEKKAAEAAAAAAHQNKAAIEKELQKALGGEVPETQGPAVSIKKLLHPHDLTAEDFCFEGVLEGEDSLDPTHKLELDGIKSRLAQELMEAVGKAIGPVQTVLRQLHQNAQEQVQAIKKRKIGGFGFG